MPGAKTPNPTLARPGAHHAGWPHFTWKLLLAIIIFLIMSVGGPLVYALALPSFVTLLIIWGGLVVGISASNLYEGEHYWKWLWVALVAVAYVALTLPELVRSSQEPGRLVDALGPVAALTLSAQLARRDLGRALRDWAIGIGLALYVALGIITMWLVVLSFGRDGPAVFLLAILLPPLTFEAVLLLLRKVNALRESFIAHVAALALSTALAMTALSFVLLHQATTLLWSVIFGLLVGLLIGGALLVAYLTRPVVEAASGARQAGRGGADLARALVEFSHGPILISLAVYLPVRLLGMVP